MFYEAVGETPRLASLVRELQLGTLDAEPLACTGASGGDATIFRINKSLQEHRVR